MSSDLESELSLIALEMVLGNGAKRPLSIPEEDWLRIKPIIQEQANNSFDKSRYPILQPARPRNYDGSQPIETTEDTFAITNDPDVRLSFSTIYACLGIEIVQGKRKMTIHLLNRSLPAQQPTLPEDIESLSNQISSYWGNSSGEAPNITFVSPVISSAPLDYHQKTIDSLKRKFPNSAISYKQVSTDVI